MNIKDAREQIKNAIIVYMEKDEDGHYLLPVEKQRPIFMIGAPGIGKTAIMEQIAEELGVALVSYSMTHHTRQSALGLPFIVHKNYGGKDVAVSEYTMSEIIAAVYDVIEESGVKEGILFLDEVNCVSETLAPAMLQFLQYKCFGQHYVPEGWMIVTAGNPQEFNDSVREFDLATWDRLKRIDVEPDFGAWKEYARKVGLHPSILTYLEIKKGNFYSIETTIDGKQFVTARGWEDLSRMMSVCERKNIPVDLRLIEQYVQCPKIARDFSVYYQLFRKYQNDYQIDTILSGRPSEKILQRASQAEFDERFSLIGLIMDSVSAEIKNVLNEQAVVFGFGEILKKIKKEIENGGNLYEEILKEIAALEEDEKKRKKAGTLSVEQRKNIDQKIFKLENCKRNVLAQGREKAEFSLIRNYFVSIASEFQKKTENAGKILSNVFEFFEIAFHGEQEMLLLVTELTENEYCAKFISQYGCEKYFCYNNDLLFYERQQELSERLRELDVDESYES